MEERRRRIRKDFAGIDMILSDKDLKEYLKSGRIKVKPLEEEQIRSIGIDLRLGNEFKLFKMNHKSHIDPSKDDIEDGVEVLKVKDGSNFIIHPGEFLLGVTKENVELPDDISARIDGRSSLGRLGIIVHSTAGRVDPGWSGFLTLEISNIGKLPVALIPGMRFCSLVFETISSPVERSYRKIGKYTGQKGPTASRIREEFEGK